MLEIFGWIRIVLSPILVAFLIAAPIYFNKPDNTGLILSIIILFAGLIIGIVWATRVWKKQGTQQFLSQISASPDLDPKTKSENDNVTKN